MPRGCLGSVSEVSQTSASKTLVGLPVTRVTAQMLPAKNCEKRNGTSGSASSWHMRMVIGLSHEDAEVGVGIRAKTVNTSEHGRTQRNTRPLQREFEPQGQKYAFGF